jgi:hypothetical protein
VALSVSSRGLSDTWRLAGLTLSHCLVIGFLGFAVVLVLRGVFKHKVIQGDQILGALCGYLLGGLAWSNLYQLVVLHNPAAFTVSPGLAWQLADEDTRNFLFNYFSFVTLTTMGYGDVTPTGPIATSLVWMEAVFGQFYLAVVVAQLVGLQLAAVQNNSEQH